VVHADKESERTLHPNRYHTPNSRRCADSVFHIRLKCNRSHPCENCVKRGDAGSCSYAQPGSRKKHALSNGTSNSPDDMQNRIDRLESLVLSLMTNGNQSAGPAAAVAALSTESATSGQSVQGVEVGDDAGDGQNDSDTESVTKSFGVMKVDNNKSYYISDAHWASVLNDVRPSFVNVSHFYGYSLLNINQDRRSSPILGDSQEAV
jgi:hypothetical protein